MSSFRMNRANNNECRVYVGNLPEDIRVREVEDIFHKYGPIKDIELKTPRGRGSPFAFLEFEDQRDAEDAVRGRDGYEYERCRLRVEFPKMGSGRGGYDNYRGSGFSRGGGTRGRGRGKGGRGFGPPRRSDYRVLISGLPPTGSWQDVKDHMREAGDVLFTDVFKDGTGIVEFARRDDMKWAIKNLSDTKFKSHEKTSSQTAVLGDQPSRTMQMRQEGVIPQKLANEDVKPYITQGETSFIKVKQDGMGRSRSKSFSPRRKYGSRSRSRSVSKSYSRSRSRSKSMSSRSRSRSRSPKK